MPRRNFVESHQPCAYFDSFLSSLTQVVLYHAFLRDFFRRSCLGQRSALVFREGEVGCIAEYCAGNFLEAVQALAPTPSVLSLDALMNTERLVRGMNLKAPVRRRSCAYPLFFHDKSVRLTGLFLDFVRCSAPSSVPVIQA